MNRSIALNDTFSSVGPKCDLRVFYLAPPPPCSSPSSVDCYNVLLPGGMKVSLQHGAVIRKDPSLTASGQLMMGEIDFYYEGSRLAKSALSAFSSSYV